MPCCKINQNIGNCYTGSVYSSLLSVIMEKTRLVIRFKIQEDRSMRRGLILYAVRITFRIEKCIRKLSSPFIISDTFVKFPHKHNTNTHPLFPFSFTKNIDLFIYLSTHSADLLEKRIAMFSYGSGSVASLFSFVGKDTTGMNGGRFSLERMKVRGTVGGGCTHQFDYHIHYRPGSGYIHSELVNKYQCVFLV